MCDTVFIHIRAGLYISPYFVIKHEFVEFRKKVKVIINALQLDKRESKQIIELLAELDLASHVALISFDFNLKRC